MDEKKNPVYANTSDIATLMHQQACVAETLQNATVSTTSATDLHQIETLKAENERLKGQLNEFGKKIGRVASLEQEMAKIHQAYQSLLKHSEKREMLEKSARGKLQAVIINLSDANKVIFIFIRCVHVKKNISYETVQAVVEKKIIFDLKKLRIVNQQ